MPNGFLYVSTRDAKQETRILFFFTYTSNVGSLGLVWEVRWLLPVLLANSSTGWTTQQMLKFLKHCTLLLLVFWSVRKWGRLPYLEHPMHYCPPYLACEHTGIGKKSVVYLGSHFPRSHVCECMVVNWVYYGQLKLHSIYKLHPLFWIASVSQSCLKKFRYLCFSRI